MRTAKPAPPRRGRRRTSGEAPGRDPEWVGWLAIAAVTAPLLAVGVLATTDWLGYGLLALLPSSAAQRTAAVALPAAIVLLVAVCAWWPTTRVRPPALAGAAGGLVAVMVALAPFGRRGSRAAVLDVVPDFARPLYLAWPVVLVVLVGALLVWGARRRRVPAAGAHPDDARATRRLLQSVGVGAGVAVVLVSTVAVTGAVVGRPLPPEDPPLLSERVTVAELAATSLEGEVRASGLGDHVAAPVLRTAAQLVGPVGLQQPWEVLGVTNAVPGVRASISTVHVEITPLTNADDVPAAAARLAEVTSGGALPAGWLAVPEAIAADPTAVVLDGQVLLQLSLNDNGTPAEQQTSLAALAGELTPERRAALVAATRFVQ